MSLFENGRCRIVFIGAAKVRVAKVFSLIQSMEISTNYRGVDIHYLPCVATFDSYTNGTGERMRYLMKVEYFPDGVNISSEGLLPFIDETTSDQIDLSTLTSPRIPLFQGISGVAIGPGVEKGDDIDQVRRYFDTILQRAVPLEAVQPNAEYSSMDEELQAYRVMDDIQKEEVTRLGIMGPGKMAKFVVNFAHQLVDEAITMREQQRKHQVETNEVMQPINVTDSHRLDPNDIPTIDADQNRYACRKCRTLLFGQIHLQDPPHVPSKHKFSHRKHGSGGISSDCQSIFLKDDVSWLGKMLDEGGKLSCPQCTVKIGTWHWSGAQCSCGTWVVPAIQVPVSKVDLVIPRRHEPDSSPIIGTVIYSSTAGY